MKFPSTTLAMIALNALPLIEAHTRFTTFYINGLSQGEGTSIRMDMNPSTTTTFVNGITSDDMACGKGGATAVNRTSSAKPGDSISMMHRAWADNQVKGFIDPSHKGTCAIYMKKMSDPGASDPFSGSAAGDGWFKIFYDGYDESENKWCTEKMIDNGGVMSTTLPSGLAGGYYLVRSEILSLQNIVNQKTDAQFYAGCAQIYFESSGDAQPETVSIPGYVSADMKSLTFNIYAQPLDLPYPEFGPTAYSSSASALTVRQDTSTDIVGNCPANTILESGNWCGVEIPSWSNDAPGYLTECWAASQKCWDINNDCWANVSPAVSAPDMSVGCNLWDKRCTDIVNWCQAGNLNGPPNAGTKLTPAPASLNPSIGDVKFMYERDIAGGISMRRGLRNTM